MDFSDCVSKQLECKLPSEIISIINMSKCFDTKSKYLYSYSVYLIMSGSYTAIAVCFGK